MIALVLGLYTRVFALALLVILIPAVFVWVPKGFWFTQAGYEMPLFWCMMQITLALLGPGAFALRSFGARRP